MITDRSRLHEVLLPINHSLNKIYDDIRLYFQIKTQEIPRPADCDIESARNDLKIRLDNYLTNNPQDK